MTQIPDEPQAAQPQSEPLQDMQAAENEQPAHLVQEAENTPHAEPGEQAKAKLILKRGGAEVDETFDVLPPATIGRFDPTVGPIDVDLAPIPEGSYVSRKHAKITCEDGVWRIIDLGSSNGTYILREDFERVEEAELKDGDELAFGNARFVFRLPE